MLNIKAIISQNVLIVVRLRQLVIIWILNEFRSYQKGLARFIDTNKASEMRSTWKVDNLSIGPSEILDYTITDTANGHPRTEIISAIFLHDPKGIVGFEVSDTDNQSDKREIIIH